MAVPRAVPAGDGRIDVRLFCTAWQLLKFWMQSASICIHCCEYCGSGTQVGSPLTLNTWLIGDRPPTNCWSATLHEPVVQFMLGKGTAPLRSTVPRAWQVPLLAQLDCGQTSFSLGRCSGLHTVLVSEHDVRFTVG